MKMIMVRVGGGLFPDGDAAWETFNKLKQHHGYLVSIQKVRNLEQLKKYWAVARAVADADPAFDDELDADWWVRCSVPWMREEIRIDGERISVRPKSIAIDAMRQDEFDKFFTRAMELWSMRIGVDVEDLRREGERRVNTRRAPGEAKEGGA